MASTFSHAFAAVAMGKACGFPWKSWRFWVLAAGSAALPDADVIAFNLNIPYENMFGHRGFTHSILFAAGWALLVVCWEFKAVVRFSWKWWGLLAFFVVATASHGVLDAFTNGGLGVGFFVPFDGTRYFFPWAPIEVSPIGTKEFFSQRGWEVIKSELLYVWVPFGVVWFGGWGLRRIVKKIRDVRRESTKNQAPTSRETSNSKLQP